MFTCRSNQLFSTKEFLVLPIGLTCSKCNIYQGLVQPSNLRFGISAIFITCLALENKLPESFQESLLAEHTKFHQYPVQAAVCKILNKLRLASMHRALEKEWKISISNYPICSTISLACLIMFAPVWQTMPAISIEYHRALKRKQKYIYNDHYNDFILSTKTAWENQLLHRKQGMQFTRMAFNNYLVTNFNFTKQCKSYDSVQTPQFSDVDKYISIRF